MFKPKTDMHRLLIGTVILDILFIVILLLFNGLTVPRLNGILFGTLYMILNFKLLSHTVQKAIVKSPNKASALMSISYFLRFTLTGVLLYLVIITDHLSLLGVAVPLFYPKIIFFAYSIFYNKK